MAGAVGPVVAGRIDRALRLTDESAHRGDDEQSVPYERNADGDGPALHGFQRARDAHPTGDERPTRASERRVERDTLERIAIEGERVGLQPVTANNDTAIERGRLRRPLRGGRQ